MPLDLITKDTRIKPHKLIPIPMLTCPWNCRNCFSQGYRTWLGCVKLLGAKWTMHTSLKNISGCETDKITGVLGSIPSSDTNFSPSKKNAAKNVYPKFPCFVYQSNSTSPPLGFTSDYSKLPHL